MRRFTPLSALVALFVVQLVMVGCNPPAEPAPEAPTDPQVGKNTEGGSNTMNTTP